MSRADERAISDYVRDFRESEETEGDPLRYVVVVSSSFPANRRPHPFVARSRRIHDEAGLQLVYLRAADLLLLAVAVEQEEASPAVREAIDWANVFDEGIVRLETLMNAHEAANPT